MRNIILSSKNAARATPQLLMLTIVVIALATALALSPGLTGSTARAQSDTEETWSGQMTAQRQQQTAVGTASQQPGAGESSEGETETAPDAPTGLITTAVSHDSVTLSWDDPDSDGENTLSGSCMGSASFKVIWGTGPPPEEAGRQTSGKPTSSPNAARVHSPTSSESKTITQACLSYAVQ